MWFGRADSLKTWLIFSLAIALASGEPWLGKYHCKKSKVGIVDYETGKNNIRRRLFMLKAGPNQHLGVLSFSSLKPNQTEFWAELAKEKFDVVFVDSLRRANQGKDENDSNEAILPLVLAAEFAEATGCAVVYIHHAKKASADGWPEFRGSVAIEDQVDCAYVVRKTGDGAAGKRLVEVKCLKPGDMRMPDAFAAEVEFNDISRTANVRLSDVPTTDQKTKKMTDEEVREAIMLAIVSYGAMLNIEEIRKHVGVRKERIVEAIRHLVDKGAVIKLPDVGYAENSREAKRKRVFDCIRKSDKWRTQGQLATAAHVRTEFVAELLREGDICRASTDPDVPGFFVLAEDAE